MTGIDHTHDPSARSWVAAAHEPGTDFPLANLPLGVFTAPGFPHQIGVAIGDRILALRALRDAGHLAGLPDDARDALAAGALNPLLALGPGAMTAVRHAVHALLLDASPIAAEGAVFSAAIADATLRLPFRVRNYTDFYASVHHATNVGSMFRPDNPLLPNYKWVPIGYHGRASSIVLSGAAVRRPTGQLRDEGAAAPVVEPTRRLDYEMEMGFVIGRGNPLGTPIPIARAAEHLAGLVLVNDWSARDVQAWEYQPLGPFLAKNFATSISPWLVTMDALAPFRRPATARPAGDPAPLAYLHDAGDQALGGLDVTLDVLLRSARMREQGDAPALVSRSSLADLYWTPAQLVTHHTMNGCDLHAGDLLASGTVSGPTTASRACLLERAWRGSEPFTLPTGETRTFLEDGDEVIMRGRAERDGFAGLGFGECRGVVLPALTATA